MYVEAQRIIGYSLKSVCIDEDGRRCSYHDCLFLSYLICIPVFHDSIGVKSSLASTGIAIEGFLPIALREFIRKTPRSVFWWYRLYFLCEETDNI